MLRKLLYGSCPVCFTFQYGSTLIRRTFQSLYDTLCLYIPIWFYFNNLIVSFSYSPGYLYIPIWFYFNPVSGRPPKIANFLYIPIWFYFNEEFKQRFPVRVKSFTFQYGSTLIMKETNALLKQILYIPIWFYFNGQCLLPYVPPAFLYIPIWFYFNP